MLTLGLELMAGLDRRDLQVLIRFGLLVNRWISRRFIYAFDIRLCPHSDGNLLSDELSASIVWKWRRCLASLDV